MSMNIHKIKEACADLGNKPGLDAEVKLVPICGVSQFGTYTPYDGSNPDTCFIISPPTLKVGYNFVTWEGRKKDMGYKAETTGDQDAEVVNATVSMYIPRIEKFKSWMMSQTLNTRYIVKFRDRNNEEQRFMGEKGNGCKVKVTEQSNPKNGYLLEITAEGLDTFPPFIEVFT